MKILIMTLSLLTTLSAQAFPKAEKVCRDEAEKLIEKQIENADEFFQHYYTYLNIVKSSANLSYHPDSDKFTGKVVVITYSADWEFQAFNSMIRYEATLENGVCKLTKNYEDSWNCNMLNENHLADSCIE